MPIPFLSFSTPQWKRSWRKFSEFLRSCIDMILPVPDLLRCRSCGSPCRIGSDLLADPLLVRDGADEQEIVPPHMPHKGVPVSDLLDGVGDDPCRSKEHLVSAETRSGPLYGLNCRGPPRRSLSPYPHRTSAEWRADRLVSGSLVRGCVHRRIDLWRRTLSCA
jgi:hypothetical protein